MADLCLMFQVHQPNRLAHYDFFRIGEHAFYEDDELNGRILSQISAHGYLPGNAMFERLLREGEFCFGMSVSGTAIEQMEFHRPDVLASFQEMVATGRVEMLCETYYHSLASLYSNREFGRQVAIQGQTAERVFGRAPQVLWNTGLVYDNGLAGIAESLDFSGIVAEGIPWVLDGRCGDRTYRAPGVEKVVTLLRNAEFSDRLGVRVERAGARAAGEFARSVAESEGQVACVVLDYEALGEHQAGGAGMFRFWEALPLELERAGVRMLMPSEVIERHPPEEVYDCHWPTSCVDHERDLSAWMGNVMQQEAMAKIHRLEGAVLERSDPALIHVWAKLQTADHFLWMSTKGGDSGHQRYCPYDSAYDAYIYFMNALADLQVRIGR